MQASDIHKGIRREQFSGPLVPSAETDHAASREGEDEREDWELFARLQPAGWQLSLDSFALASEG